MMATFFGVFKSLKIFFAIALLSTCCLFANLLNASDTTLEAQKLLKMLGYSPGPLDGLLGTKTRTALESFYVTKKQRFDGTLGITELEDLRFAVRKLSKPITKFNNINHSTGRYMRTQLMCQIATVDKLKPFPTGLDDFRSAPEMSTYADLFGDGSIEFITGAYDSTIVLESQSFPNKGNKKRALFPSEHVIYSPMKNFELGVSLKFHNAHILTADLNLDGAHDLIFVQQGRDFAPFQRKSNFILLSSNDGYRLKKLPGKKSPYHGGATGDIDNDGDIDIIIVPGFENRVVAYVNDGFGNFEFKEIAGTRSKSWSNNARYFFAGLWDFDDDGYLDLILGSQLDHTKIIWGNGTVWFAGPHTILGDKDDYFMDFEFKDFDGDGKRELITFGGNYDGILGKSPQDNPYYHGWHIQKFLLEKRRVTSYETIERVQNTSHLFLAKFSACDIQNDNDYDLVYERNRQFYRTRKLEPQFDFSTVTRIIWFNKNGDFKRVRIEDPNYYRSYEEMSRSLVIEHAKKLGTTAIRYFPTQQYYEYKSSGNYIHANRPPMAKPYLDTAH